MAHPDDVAFILDTPSGNVDVQDQLIWHYSKDVNYNVKSGYKVASINKTRASVYNERLMNKW